jgi:hypothetical protein
MVVCLMVKYGCSVMRNPSGFSREVGETLTVCDVATCPCQGERVLEKVPLFEHSADI